MSKADIINQIVSARCSLSASEIKLADYILNHYSDLHMTLLIRDLAANCGVSEATVSRFCRHIGYVGYNQFKLALAQNFDDSDSDANENPPATTSDYITQESQHLYQQTFHSLSKTMSLVDPAAIHAAVDLLEQADHVLCYGAHDSHIAAMEMWRCFSPVTPKFNWTSEVRIFSDMAISLSDRDVIVLFYAFRESRALFELSETLRKTNAKIILIARHPIPNEPFSADVSLFYGKKPKMNQECSILKEIGLFFTIELLYKEYCSKSSTQTPIHENAVQEEVVI